jgi:hypothetical protein
MVRVLLVAWVLVAVPSSVRAACFWGDVAGYDCGLVTAEGCCKDGTHRYWCEGGVLCVEECFFADCGWTLLDGYACDTLMGMNSNDCPPIPTQCDPCGDVTEPGCCDDDVLYWCEDGCLQTIDCYWNDAPDDVCGWDPASGFYDCGGDGADPSGVSPWSCDGTCVPDCAGKACGPDGCGGACGTCAEGTQCVSGACEPGPCVPDCAGKACGPDGCGGACGTCVEGWMCRDGACAPVQVCVSDCEGRECGPDGCDGVCGTCVPPKKCNDEGRCYEPETCIPSCGDRECGTDGCGGVCGRCGQGETCVDGACVVGVPDAGAAGDAGGTADRDSGPAGEAVADPGNPGTTCAEGKVLRYGQCVEPEAPPAVDSSSGGCGTGRVGDRGAWWMLVAGLAWTRFRRRAHR